MTEVGTSDRSDQDMGEAGDVTGGASVMRATETAMTMTPIVANTASTATLEPTERNENGKRRRSETPAAAMSPGDWRSRMDRTVQQQACELAQLHRTVTMMATMLGTQTALQETQWRSMSTWLEEREEKWETRHQDDVLWSTGITNMVAKVMAGMKSGGQKETGTGTRDTDNGGLEASQHADPTQIGGPEKPKENQQLQPKLQPKPQPKPESKPIPRPTPKTTPTPTPTPAPTRWWETVPPRNQNQKKVMVAKTADPGPAPTTGSSMADRRLILRRDESVPLPRKMDQEIASVINRALFRQQAPAHIRIMNVRRNAKGAITAITHQNATAEMALLYRDIIISAARTVDMGVIDVEGNESWERLKIHAVPLIRYMGKGTEGLQKMREEIQAENEGVAIPAQVRWLANPRTIKERRQNGEITASSVVFVVKGS